MNYNGADYIFIKDMLDNITEIYDADGIVHARYSYDAWGNTIHKSGDLADINPFRYRGYYMDIETGWYYLQTRYYDPAVRRFINADNYELIPQLAQNNGELNLYSYCNNNPISYTDETGESILVCLAFLAVSLIVAGTISGTGSAIAAAATGQDAWAAFCGGFVNGAISSLGITIALACGPAGILVAGVFGLAGGALGSAVSQKISTGSVDWKIAAINGGVSAAMNMITFGLTSWFLAGTDGLPVGTFLQKLGQAFAPDAGMLIGSMFIGTMVAGSEAISRTITHYGFGGKYGKKSVLKLLYV